MPQRFLRQALRQGSFSLDLKRIAILALLCISLVVVEAAGQGETIWNGDILTGSQLTEGFDMGINTSGGQTGWLEAQQGCLAMKFPANQNWAAAFVTAGPVTDTSRETRDVSAFKSLVIEMKGEKGGEQVLIGVKTNVQPNDGKETKIPYTLKPDWFTYTIPVAELKSPDLHHLYVMTEFVYLGREPQSVYVRSIKYVK